MTKIIPDTVFTNVSPYEEEIPNIKYTGKQNAPFICDNNFEKIIYFTVLQTFISMVDVEGLDDFEITKEDFLFKWINASACLINFGNMYYIVNTTWTDWNLYLKPVEVKIIEPYAPNTLNNKTLSKENDDLFLIRFNINNASLWYLVKELIKEISISFNKAGTARDQLIDKILINTHTYKQNAKQQNTLNGMVRSGDSVKQFDFGDVATGDGIDKNFYHLQFTDSTQPMKNMIEFYEKEIFKLLGFPINNQQDKKGANLISNEIEVNNITTKFRFNHFIDIANADLKEFNKKYGLNVRLINLLEKEEKEMEVEETENEPIE